MDDLAAALDPPPPQRGLSAPLRATLLLIYAAAAAWLASRGAAAEPLPPDRVFLLHRTLQRAQAAVRQDGQERPCVWHPGDRRFVCGPETWAFVGPYAGFAGGKPTRCVWAHPQPGGGAIVLRFADEVLGERVEGRVALLDEVGSGADVTLRVLAGGDEVGSATASEGREPARFDAKLPPGPPRGELRIEVVAREHFWRHACIEVLMLGRRPGHRDVRPAPEPATPPSRAVPLLPAAPASPTEVPHG
jgi:hypothetical protein